MHDLWIPARNIYVKYPECWDELRGKADVIFVGGVLFRVFMGELDVYNGKKQLVDYFLHRKNRIKKPVKGEEAWTYWANEFRLSETVNWVFELTRKKDEAGIEILDDEQYQINPKFTRQQIPFIRTGLWKHYGPGDLLSGISFMEFKEAMICMEEFAQTKDVALLDRLAALLYAPLEFRFIWSNKEQKRVRYSSIREKRSIKRMKKLDIGFKFWCFLLFLGSINYLKEEPVLIDGREYRLSCLFGGGGGSKDNTGLAGVMFSMAESGVFGSLEETSHAHYFDVALRLYQLHKQAEEMRSKMKT